MTTEKAPEKPKAAAPGPEKVAAPVTEVQRAAVAQEVMLVPTMVYRPFVAANPTMPVRLGSNMTVAQPQEQPPVGAPKTEDTLKKAVDTCEKLQERIIYLEKCLKERSAPTVVCPPSQPVCPPFFRRPLFNRCEPLFNRGQCETMVPCEQPAPMPEASRQPAAPPMPPVLTVTPETPESAIPLPQMPRRVPTVID